MTDGVSRRRVSHLCSLVRLGTRSREGINSLGISINFVPRLAGRRRWSVDESENGIRRISVWRRRTLPPSPLPAVRDPFTNKSKRGSAPRSLPPSLPGNYHGRRSRAARFTTVREFRQFTTNDWLEKRGRMDSLPAEKGN